MAFCCEGMLPALPVVSCAKLPDSFLLLAFPPVMCPLLRSSRSRPPVSRCSSRSQSAWTPVRARLRARRAGRTERPSPARLWCPADCPHKGNA
eukprot:649959-Prorocentrum_minimum.AAC.5